MKALRVLALGPCLALLAACSKEAPGPADDLVREKAARFFNLPEAEYGNARTALKPLVERKDAAVDDLVAAAAIEYGDAKHPAAAQFLERAKQLVPDHAGARFLQGQLARDAGDYAKAREHLRVALAGAPDDLPTKLALAEAEYECDDAARAEALYAEVVRVGIENGQAWYVTAVYRMTRLLAVQPGRESDLAKYNALWAELGARGIKAPDPTRLGLGNLGRMRAPKPRGTSVEKPVCPPALSSPNARCGPPMLPELGGARGLEAWDLDGDLQLDLVAWGSRGLCVALRRDHDWVVQSLTEKAVERVTAVDLANDSGGTSWLALVVQAGGALEVLRPDPVTEIWNAWPLRLPDVPRGLAHTVAVDFDHEGDMDLLLVGTFGARLWRNDGANDPDEGGRFSDASTAAGLPAQGGFTWAVTEDLDGDNDVDCLLGGPGVLFLADSLRAGRFADGTARAFGPDVRLAGVPLVADFDGDARPDLWTPEALWRQRTDGTFQREATGRTAAGSPAHARVGDVDLDGAPDVIEISYDNVALAHLAVGLSVATTCTLGSEHTSGSEGPFVLGDLCGDKHVHMAVSVRSGVELYTFPAGPHHAVRLSYRGLRDNRRAVGAIVELKSGSIYRRMYWRGHPELAGVGKNDRVDVLRITWPNGVVQTEVDLDLKPKAGVDDPDAAFSGMTQSNAQTGSCPFLYTWNGERFVFVTDVLGITPLGLRIAPGVFVPPDHDEYVLVKGEELAPRDGFYAMHFTEELREVTYLDHAKLIVVDHPEGTEVFPNERFTFPPFPEAHTHTVKGALAPAKATGSDGRDWTKELAAIDDVHALPFTREAPQFAGLAKPWFVELAFDREAVARAVELRLLMTGWFYWSDASANMASAGTPDVRFVPPILQVPDGSGGWKDCGPPVGFPAGKTKTMVIDVGAHLKRDDPRVRVFCTLQLHWDALRLAVDGDDAPLAVRELPVSEAQLWMRGFSAPLERRAPTEWSERPERFEWGVLEPFPRWNQHPGLYTRYGDVLPLTQAIDDRFVILGAGDALTLRFDARAVPPPAAGMRRDYLVFLDGWAKDRDPNTVEALEVEPLPFHGMSGYPYRADERFPDDEVHRAWRAEWNTRPAHAWIPPVAPVRIDEWLHGRP